MPIVVMKDGVNWSSLNRRRRHDLPTPKHTPASVYDGKTHRPALRWAVQCEKGVCSEVTAISDQKQFNKIVIVSICCHDAENMLKDKSCNGRLFEKG